MNCPLEDETHQTMEEFHKVDCVGHHSCKVTVNNSLRVGFYWPTLFSDVYKDTAKYHHCQVFKGKRNLSYSLLTLYPWKLHSNSGG